MSEEKKENRFKKIALYCFKNLVNIIFGLLATYYALLAFVLEVAPFENKVMLGSVVALWLLWIFAKAVIVLVISIIIVLLIAAGWYYYTHYDEIACKNNGGVWNKQERICEEKVDLWKRIQEVWQNRTFLKFSEESKEESKKDK